MDSALVSWMEPWQHNGQLLKYTVYWREVENNRSKTSITIPRSLRQLAPSGSSSTSTNSGISGTSGSMLLTGNAHLLPSNANLNNGGPSSSYNAANGGKYFYILKNGGRRRYRKLPESQPQYKLSALRPDVHYQLWLSASTRRGEGPASPVQYFRPRLPTVPRVLEFSQSIALGPSELDGQLPLLLTCTAFSTQQVTRKWIRYLSIYLSIIGFDYKAFLMIS